MSVCLLLKMSVPYGLKVTRGQEDMTVDDCVALGGGRRWEGEGGRRGEEVGGRGWEERGGGGRKRGGRGGEEVGGRGIA